MDLTPSPFPVLDIVKYQIFAYIMIKKTVHVAILHQESAVPLPIV